MSAMLQLGEESVQWHSELTVDKDNMLCISKQLEEMTWNAFSTKKV